MTVLGPDPQTPVAGSLTLLGRHRRAVRERHAPARANDELGVPLARVLPSSVSAGVRSVAPLALLQDGLS